MFELLLSLDYDKYISLEYPDSGPGNKWLLSGNPQLGYFGEIPSSSVMSYQAYRDNLSPNLDMVLNTNDQGWFKFFYKGKILLVSKKVIGTSTSWNLVYAAGGIYGTNNTGSIPGSPAVNQYKPVDIVEGNTTWKMVPRCLHAGIGNPSANIPGSQDTIEFNSLIGRVSAKVGSQQLPKQGEWAQYTTTQLDLDNTNLTIETNIDTTRINGKGSAGNALNVINPTKSSKSVNLRAVLELESFTRT